MIAYSLGISTTSTAAGATAFEVTSTEEEAKTVDFVEYWDIGSNPVFLTVWLEREKIVDSIPLEVVANCMPVRRIDLNVAIPVGETLTAKLISQGSSAHGVMEGMVSYRIGK